MTRKESAQKLHHVEKHEINECSAMSTRINTQLRPHCALYEAQLSHAKRTPVWQHLVFEGVSQAIVDAAQEPLRRAPLVQKVMVGS